MIFFSNKRKIERGAGCNFHAQRDEEERRNIRPFFTLFVCRPYYNKKRGIFPHHLLLGEKRKRKNYRGFENIYR